MRSFSTVALLATTICATQTLQDDTKALTFVSSVDGDTLTVEVTSTRTVDDDFVFENWKNTKQDGDYITLYMGFALTNAVRLEGMSSSDNKMKDGALEAGEWGDTAVASWNANSGATQLFKADQYDAATKVGEIGNTSWTLGSSGCQGKTCSFKFSRSLSGSPEIELDEEYVVTTLTGVTYESETTQSDYVKICIGDCTESETEATEMAGTDATGSGAVTYLIATATALGAILMF